jgi:drug/metabolite transporter (DMT)-like permease
VILSAAIAFLSVSTVLGWSGFVRGGTFAAVAGVVMSVACGALMTAMLLYGNRLDKRGVGPVAQFGLRFPLFLAVALAAFLVGIDDKGAVPTHDMLIAVAAGLVLLAFPVFAVQKAVSLSSTLTIGSAAAVTPLVVFLLQMVEGRVDYSRATLAGLAIYFAGAMLAAMGSVRAAASEVRRAA